MKILSLTLSYSKSLFLICMLSFFWTSILTAQEIIRIDRPVFRIANPTFLDSLRPAVSARPNVTTIDPNFRVPGPQPEVSKNKVALLIGNSNYPGQNALSTPKRDIKVMSVALKKMGFTIWVIRNGTREKMREGILNFIQNAAEANTTFLYYGGHTLTHNEKNYLVPIDAELRETNKIRSETFDLDAYVQMLDPLKENLISIDACYYHRFPYNFDNNESKPCFEEPIDLPENTFISFTVGSNMGAQFYDPAKRNNSLFTTTIAEEIKNSPTKYDSYADAQKIIKAISAGKQGLTAFGSITNRRSWKNFGAIYATTSNINFFPWPPPKPSAFDVLPHTAFTNCTQLKDVDAILSNALDESGYYEKSYFPIEGENMQGFALATRLEQINKDGSSKPGKKWGLDDDDFSFKEYFTSLFFPHTGYFRVIVFIVIDVPFDQSSNSYELTAEAALGLLNQGTNVLFEELGNITYSDNHAVTALIYEYQLPDNDIKASLATPSQHPGRVHLEKSTFWKEFTED